MLEHILQNNDHILDIDLVVTVNINRRAPSFRKFLRQVDSPVLERSCERNSGCAQCDRCHQHGKLLFLHKRIAFTPLQKGLSRLPGEAFAVRISAFFAKAFGLRDRRFHV